MATQETDDAIEVHNPKERRASLPVVVREESVADLKLKIKYFGWVGIPMAGLLELMGAQVPGLGLALATGVTAAYFAGEIHYAIEPGLRYAQQIIAFFTSNDAGRMTRMTSRLLNKAWWLGEEIAPYVDDGEYEDGEVEEEDEEEGEMRSAPKMQLNIGPTLRPHINSFFGSRTGIFGIPGSGKSNTVAVLLEELGEYECPLLVLDTENENAELCTSDYFLNPLLENAASITVQNAYDIGQAIMECNLQIVLNLQSYKSDDEAAMVMIELIEGINDWEEAQTVRVPVAIVLDEAAKWLPQKSSQSTLSKNRDKEGLTLLEKLQRTFLGTVASRGRKRGMGLIFATQRLATLNKDLILCDWLFLLRQTLLNDLTTYRGMGCPSEIAQKLGNGQAFVITPTKDHAVHQIRKRFSESGANTPGLAELQEYRSSRSRTPFTRPVPQAQSAQNAQMEKGEMPRGSMASETPEMLTRPNLSVVSSSAETPRSFPQEVTSQLVEGVERNSETFLPEKEDSLLSELQAELLIVFYRHCNNVNKSLEQIKNDKGQGLSGRYFRHASYILERRGLKKRRT